MDASIVGRTVSGSVDGGGARDPRAVWTRSEHGGTVGELAQQHILVCSGIGGLFLVLFFLLCVRACVCVVEHGRDWWNDGRK